MNILRNTLRWLGTSVLGILGFASCGGLDPDSDPVLAGHNEFICAYGSRQPHIKFQERSGIHPETNWGEYRSSVSMVKAPGRGPIPRTPILPVNSQGRCAHILPTRSSLSSMTSTAARMVNISPRQYTSPRRRSVMVTAPGSRVPSRSVHPLRLRKSDFK